MTEPSTVTQAETLLADLVQSLEAGDLFVEDIPENLLVRLRSLFTTHAPSQPVTEEMIIRARIAWRNMVEASDDVVDVHELMRTALNAAAIPAPSQPTALEDYLCANCQGVIDELAQGRDPEELCDTCYDDSQAAVAMPAPSQPMKHDAKLTDEYLAMTPVQKWETLCANGLIGTNEPWIEDMRQSLKAMQSSSHPIEYGREHTDGSRSGGQPQSTMYPRTYLECSVKDFGATPDAPSQHNALADRLESAGRVSGGGVGSLMLEAAKAIRQSSQHSELADRLQAEVDKQNLDYDSVIDLNVVEEAVAALRQSPDTARRDANEYGGKSSELAKKLRSFAIGVDMCADKRIMVCGSWITAQELFDAADLLKQPATTIGEG